MSLIEELAQWIEGMEAAGLLAPEGVLTESAPHAVGLTLCDEGETSAVTDVTGVRTAVRAFALLCRTVLLTQAERAAARDACEGLCAQINAAPYPPLSRGVLQDIHCSAPTLTEVDAAGLGTYRIPLWAEVRG